MPRIRIIYVTAQRAQSTKIRNFALSSNVADFGRSLHMFLNEYCSHLLAQFRLCVFDIRYIFFLFVYTAHRFLSLLQGLLLTDTHLRGSTPLKIVNCWKYQMTFVNTITPLT